MDNRELVDMAIKAAQNSYSPYSNFVVGAAILADSGKVYTGANIENASYSVTICAERVALFNAICAGEKSFQKIAIVGGKNAYFSRFCMPCGSCRQALSEFCSEKFELVLGNSSGEYKIFTLGELFPEAFTNI